jgi:hypothetical protein
MTVIIPLLILVLQGIPALPEQTGTITGVVRYSQGQPAAGIRIMAVPIENSAVAAGNGAEMSSLAQTDEEGRYRLENVPAGRYHIAAGRTGVPTWYPGTPEQSSATVVRVLPKLEVAAIDFSIRNESIRQANTDRDGDAVIPIVLQVDGGNVPVFSGGQPVLLRMTRTSNGLAGTALLSDRYIKFPLPTRAASDHRVTIENLPANYVVKSLTYGSTDLRTGTLHVPASFIIGGPSHTPVSIQGGGTFVFSFEIPVIGHRDSRSTTAISITLERLPQARQASGVRVSGQARPRDDKPVYLSGIPATLFADGTFEFLGVPAGRHSIATLDVATRALGASIVVGNSDLDGIDLEDIRATPTDIQIRKPPTPTSNRVPGPRLPLTAIRGRIVDETTKQPLDRGLVFIDGPYSPSSAPNEDGRFEIDRLVPGTYSIEVRVLGYAPSSQIVSVGDSGADILLTVRKL